MAAPGLGNWAIGIGSTTKDKYVVVDLLDNAHGAKTWRKNLCIPSADGKRVYYIANDTVRGRG
ncbi:MAG: hypothetical protein JNG86_21385 [Verrucomicrobiaceae bacterium]|nr:hypothetical protein [Verrucomicrobiaceae bacterium]